MSERLSPEAERLVSAGRAGLAPSAEDIERLRGRILAGVAAGVAVSAAGAGAAAAASTGGAAAATGSAATAGGLGLIKVVVVAAAVTGASITGGVLVVRRADPGPAPVATVHQQAAPDAAPSRPRAVDRAPVVEPLVEPAADAAPLATPVEPPGPRPETAPPRPSLASEMELLRRARSALRAGDPRAALEHLERHAEQFPDSPLAPEAAAVRIEATCAVGDRETAGALADQFVRRWPDSPLARRVPHLCGEEP